MVDKLKTAVTPAAQGVAGKLRGNAAFVRSEEPGWDWFATGLERLASEHEAEIDRLRADLAEARKTALEEAADIFIRMASEGWHNDQIAADIRALAAKEAGR